MIIGELMLFVMVVPYPYTIVMYNACACVCTSVYAFPYQILHTCQTRCPNSPIPNKRENKKVLFTTNKSL